MKVSWKSLSSIFATVTISPWNLLVGGLLIQHLSFFNTVFVIIAGYVILGVIFITYGGLGFIYKKQSSEILARVFPSKDIKFIISLILAAGQIGWAGINFELGGRSLGILLSLPSVVGILLYAFILIFWAMLNLRLLGFTKWFVVVASVGLMAWVGVEKLHSGSLSAFVSHVPSVGNSLFWGISIVVASLISFATVSPDFFKDVKERKDIVVSAILGIILPGSLTALLGAFLFFDRSNFDLVALIGTTSFFFLPHLFNAVTNTDGTIATLIAGLKFESVLKTSYKKGVLISGGISMILAMLGITAHLEIWLKFLSILFPIFIGICFPAIVYQQYKKKKTYRKNLIIAFTTSLILAMFFIGFYPPVIIALLAPLIIFSVSLSYIGLSLLSL